MSDPAGLLLVLGLSAANTHNSEELVLMLSGRLSRHDSDRRRQATPKRLYADKAYARSNLRRWVRAKHITPWIARKGIEASDRVRWHRWAIEHIFSWLSGYRRPAPRYERDPRLYL
ncbi:transposase [Actinopolyspora mzabensis]|uniref:transposase n=1 Tax=Actinopolyspora mzabensis TaxID=995066 RepID=UPI0015A1501A